MAQFFKTLIFLLSASTLQAQAASSYTVSFENAIHHEAQISATFSNIRSNEVVFTMSRSSPGRYALHEFVKNVYNVKVSNGKGEPLNVTRPDPYSWLVSGHDGTIHVSYTLFANHGDGTYAQIDETHAHLNMPAVFMYVPELSDREIEVTFEIPEKSGWKVATQLKHLYGNTYFAKDFQYFMDSPVEIANFHKRTFKVKDQYIHLILHDDAASQQDIDSYFENIKKIVFEQEAVFGELPQFDYGEYIFLACYMPNATGDGMEHRNSTVIPSTRSLANGGGRTNIGTVAHEFFHCWNVERIRPKSMEPFHFLRANMSGELWFAEGFTSYYDDLSMVRAGIITKEEYLDQLVGTFNYVWTSPARQFFNPIEMSYQAPFVDAARSVDEVNRENTFISYYSYGTVLGLALDLSLRERGLNLDGFMKLMWHDFGKAEKFYTNDDLNQTLNRYAGKEFGDHFFNSYIFKSDMPDYSRLFKQMGVVLKTNERIDFGANVRSQKLISNPKIGSPAYESNFQKGDKIIAVDDIEFSGNVSINSVLGTFKVGETIKIIFERFGNQREAMVKIKPSNSYDIKLMAPTSKEFTKKVKQKQMDWLNGSR
ncbi:MAG TPA: PDZ domain-containing protein [Aquaticitalea sp.]|nr:PDZ domain-containing protein [Aquaticitalea sp.]